ncbi:transposase [Streptomyces sp. MI02-7b]|uniref:transposase n=1 Tax=Streptomyces sp. MI02-7b TaxID=462941 RepID=UPI0029CA36EE|nr:transposase [Streptomyces sp. MI02-7b]
MPGRVRAGGATSVGAGRRPDFRQGRRRYKPPWNRGQRPNPHPEAVVPLQQHRRLGLRRRPRRRSTGRRTSWTAVLDAVGLGPANDATAVTAVQLRDVATRLRQPGRRKPGDPDMLIVVDSGHDVTHLAHVLSDLPIELVGRLRSDRVMLRDAGPRRSGPRGGQPAPEHGGVLTFATPRPGTHAPSPRTPSAPAYGTAETLTRDRMHPRLQARGPVPTTAVNSG